MKAFVWIEIDFDLVSPLFSESFNILSCNPNGRFFLDEIESLTINLIELDSLLDFVKKNGTEVTSFLRFICIVDKIMFTLFKDNFIMLFEFFFFFFE